MASKLALPSNMRAQVMRILRPVTKWGRATLWLGIVSLVFWTADILGAKMGGWASFTTIVFAFFAIIMAFRWGYRPVLWRLRNRLIVAYLFIAVVPMVLLLAMAMLFYQGYISAIVPIASPWIAKSFSLDQSAIAYDLANLAHLYCGEIQRVERSDNVSSL